MKLKIKRLDKTQLLPRKAHASDAGVDLYAASYVGAEQCGALYKHTYRLGVAMSVPVGYVIKIYPRSSIRKANCWLSNSVGIGDAGYTGEYQATFYSVSPEPPYTIGERCCQAVVEKLPDVEIEEVDSLEETDRGDGGFGSTGK